MPVFSNYCTHTERFRFNTAFCLQETNGQVCLISYDGGICHSKCQKYFIDVINKISTVMILMSLMWHACFSFNLKPFWFLIKYSFFFSSRMNCLPCKFGLIFLLLLESFYIRMWKHTLKKWRWNVMNFPGFLNLLNSE